MAMNILSAFFPDQVRRLAHPHDAPTRFHLLPTLVPLLQERHVLGTFGPAQGDALKTSLSLQTALQMVSNLVKNPKRAQHVSHDVPMQKVASMTSAMTASMNTNHLDTHETLATGGTSAAFGAKNSSILPKNAKQHSSSGGRVVDAPSASTRQLGSQRRFQLLKEKNAPSKTLNRQRSGKLNRQGSRNFPPLGNGLPKSPIAHACCSARPPTACS